MKDLLISKSRVIDFCFNLISVACPNPPPSIVNARIDEPLETGLYVPGHLVYYMCNYGYLSEGYTHIECLEDGTWTEPDIECIGT